VVLRSFSYSLSNAARAAADVAGQQHYIELNTLCTNNTLCLSSRALGAVSLQRLSQRSLQAAVAWLRSAGGTTHSKPTLLESASQPALAIRIQIILAFVPSGTHRTVWEGGLFTVHTRTFCPPSSSASAPVQEAPFAPSAGKIQHPCSDACSSDEPATGASSNHLLQHPSSVGDVGSADFISAHYRLQPIPASDHRICWPIAPCRGYLQGTSTGALSAASLRRNLSVF
jgi:hypothetical protein